MPTHLPEGDRTKRYEKIDFLGEGQFATVYKAKDTQDDNKIVAGMFLSDFAQIRKFACQLLSVDSVSS